MLKELGGAEGPYKLTPKKFDAYVELISDLGLADVKGNYIKMNRKGARYMLDYIKLIEDLLEMKKSQNTVD